ncbi:type II secretion system protein GspM [Amphibiibacter pelophylacis]|uniref:Type II secretion system protein GspM n=1 Tax=Amphibiibacter pelophylacis TaxID=1799477 RepID=A0ACC6P3R1_9BURK
MSRRGAFANFAALAQPLRQRWTALQPRERRGVLIAGVAVALLVLWGGLLRPALKGIPRAQAELAQLRAQNDQVQQQVAQASVLRKQPGLAPLSAQQRQQALDAATQALGAAGQLSVQGDSATLTLKNVGPQALQRWLQAVQLGAQARPGQVQLDHGPQGWSGQIVLTLAGAP